MKKEKQSAQYYTKYITPTPYDGSKGKRPLILRILDGDQETQDYNWEEGNKLVDYGFVQQRMGTILGQILTTIDASITDKVQNKAVKDIIKQIFVDEYIALTDMLFDSNSLARQIDNSEEIMEVSTNQALNLN